MAAHLCLLVCPLISHSGVGRWQQVAGEGGDGLGQDVQWEHREHLRQGRSPQEPVRTLPSACGDGLVPVPETRKRDLGHFRESIGSLGKRCL